MLYRISDDKDNGRFDNLNLTEQEVKHMTNLTDIINLLMNDWKVATILITATLLAGVAITATSALTKIVLNNIYYYYTGTYIKPTMINGAMIFGAISGLLIVSIKNLPFL